MKVKQVLDEVFANVKFDASLHKKIIQNNVSFITSTDDHKNFFGSRLVGCHYFSYTYYHKDVFYENLFDLPTEVVVKGIENITSIPKNFKIARDDVNLVCFYVAHRFLSNKDLDKKKQLEYATDILNYFTYRTLVLIASVYWIYPISEDKALSLTERLSNRYIIKQLKNWNEYASYRSEEYLKNKYLPLLVKMNDDRALPNAITDLFGRSKDTLKSIYSEFVAMMESDEIIQSKRAVISDASGEDVVLDKIGGITSYINKLDAALTDKSSFIKKEYIAVVTDIINSVSNNQMYDSLSYIVDYAQENKKANDAVYGFVRDVVVNTVTYLQNNHVFLNSKTSLLDVINHIVGNVLYARGTDLDINKVKDDGDKLLKMVYKHNKMAPGDRLIRNLRNAVYIYIVLYMLVND